MIESDVFVTEPAIMKRLLNDYAVELDLSCLLIFIIVYNIVIRAYLLDNFWLKNYLNAPFVNGFGYFIYIFMLYIYIHNIYYPMYNINTLVCSSLASIINKQSCIVKVVALYRIHWLLKWANHFII